VHPLWFYKYQHDNRVRSACQRWWFQWRFWFIPSVTGYTPLCFLKLCIPPSNVIVRLWLFPEFGAELPLDNCTPTIILNNPISPSNVVVRLWLFPEFGAELPSDNCTPTIILKNPIFDVQYATSLIRLCNLPEISGYKWRHSYERDVPAAKLSDMKNRLSLNSK